MNNTLLLVDCASCGTELVGLTNPESVIAAALSAGQPVLAGRIDGRPHCTLCLGVSVGPRGRRVTHQARAGHGGQTS